MSQLPNSDEIENMPPTQSVDTINTTMENKSDSNVQEINEVNIAAMQDNATRPSVDNVNKDTTSETLITLDNIKDQNEILESTESAKTLKRAAEVETDMESQSMLVERVMAPQMLKKKKVELYAEDWGPQMYNVKGKLVTPSIITKNLPKVFEYLPVFGKPKSKAQLDDFYRSKIREFVGCELDDDGFHELERYCSPEHLKTGKELVMNTNIPMIGLITDQTSGQLGDDGLDEAHNLCIVKKCKLRIEKDSKGIFTKKLKYRGINVMSQEESEKEEGGASSCQGPSEELEPGRDLLYRVRLYRPYMYHTSAPKERCTRGRHAVFSCDVAVCGRQALTALRDRFVCNNDFDMRLDVADNPDALPAANAKELFPSGFLFINNVFYVDTREGCIDYSAPIRQWAKRRGIGDFPRRDMAAVRMDELVLKLGHPDVYVHQGNCEHIFIFSEVRLLNASDPLRLSQYPHSTAVAQNQTMYCTTCAEYAAKWIVVGCIRVPFDPSFFCDTCFKLYLYKDGKKIGDFKAYSYRGNVLNVLKPQ